MFLLKSCGNTKDVTSMNIDKDEPHIETLSGLYAVTSLGVNKNLPLDLTLEFEQNSNKVSGFSGCNRFLEHIKGRMITFLFLNLLQHGKCA